MFLSTERFDQPVSGDPSMLNMRDIISRRTSNCPELVTQTGFRESSALGNTKLVKSGGPDLYMKWGGRLAHGSGTRDDNPTMNFAIHAAKPFD